MGLRNFRVKILKVFFWECLITGALTCKISKNKKQFKSSPVLRTFCCMWLIATFGSAMYYLEWLTFESSEQNFNMKVLNLTMLNMYGYSIVTFLVIRMLSDKIIDIINQIVKFIDIKCIESIITNEIMFELFSVNILLLAFDVYFYLQDSRIYEFTDIKYFFLFLSFYPRRFVLVAVLIVLHLASESLKMIGQQNLGSTSESKIVILHIFDLLSRINTFVQYSLLFNSVMFMRNAYSVSFFIVKSMLSTHEKDITSSTALLSFSVFLPNELGRLWIIIKCCSEVRIAVNRGFLFYSIRFNHLLSIFS